MLCVRSSSISAGLLAVLVLAGCSPEPEAGPTSTDCGDLVRQARYESQAAVARAGLAADPARLAELAQVSATGPVVELPDYDVFSGWDDGRRATVEDALASTSTGVGSIITEGAIADSLDASGPCQDWMD